jgi:hypothetical protein
LRIDMPELAGNPHRIGAGHQRQHRECMPGLISIALANCQAAFSPNKIRATGDRRATAG